MDHQIEQTVIAICKLLHPQDLGKETSILENKIRKEVEHLLVQVMRKDCPRCYGEGTYRQFIEGEMDVSECFLCKGNGKA